MAHPHVQARRRTGVILEAFEQRILGHQFDLGMAEFTRVSRFGRTPELRGECLHAVADAEDRQAGVEHFLRRLGRIFDRGRFRATRQDDALGSVPGDLGGIVVPRPDFAVNPDFADAACDQLRVLGAEVEDQDLVGMDVGHGGP